MLNKAISFIFLTILVSLSGLKSQDATIFFSVNMSYQIQTGNFDPDVDFVDIAGDFNGWGSNLTMLSDEDQDYIYKLSISGFYVSQTIQFKFRKNGLWDGSEEFPGGGSNRVHTVLTTMDSLFFWYNDETPSTGSLEANFYASQVEIKDNANVQFFDISSGEIDYWNWSFEGGISATSSLQNPNVFYSNAGVFDVQLIVGNSLSSDTLLITDFITVNDRNREHIAWWNNTVFYEAFVRSFYDSDGDGIGDFNGFTEKLDYLNDGNMNSDEDLGIGGIWLMPINNSPSYHGYDVTNYYGINPDYGTMAEFQTFLDSAHARGIKVIIDLVMNHTSTQHQWFIDSKNYQNNKRNYYRWSPTDPGQTGPWGQDVWHWHNSGYYYGVFWGGMPDLNYEEPDVVASMFDVAEYWLNDIGVDGFRLDAAGLIIEDGGNLEHTPATIQFWKDFNTHTKSIAPESFSVGEVWTNTNTIVDYVVDDGLDFCFEFDLAGTILNTVNDENASSLCSKISEVYNAYPFLQWGTFLTNHDMNRVFNSLSQNPDKNKLAASIYLTLPGIPFIYYGEEIGMLGEKPDEDIRRPMQWDAGYQAGFTTGWPWHNINSNYSTFNVATELADSNSILHRYKKMISIRNLKPALQEGDYLEAPADKNPVFSFLRVAEDDTALVIINTAPYVVENITINHFSTGMQNGNYDWWDLMTNKIQAFHIDADQMMLLTEMEAMEVMILSPNQLSGTHPIDIDLKVFLEGPFNGTDMENVLNPSVLPITQPYDAAPWNYDGTESVTSIPSPDIVDWVLIEFREAPDAASATQATIVERQAAFLKKDGSVVGIDGSSMLSFNHSINHSLFVVIRHRNHIDIISANPLTKLDGIYPYDFSTSLNKVLGGAEGYKFISPGTYGMAAGDIDANGTVNVSDIFQWTLNGGNKSYFPEDLNFDGEVNNLDKDDVWILNNNSFSSLVPE